MAKKEKEPVFRVTIGKVAGGKYTFTKKQVKNLADLIRTADSAFKGNKGVKEVILVRR